MGLQIGRVSPICRLMNLKALLGELPDLVPILKVGLT
jgi:hypothetical protein